MRQWSDLYRSVPLVLLLSLATISRFVIADDFSPYPSTVEQSPLPVDPAAPASEAQHDDTHHHGPASDHVVVSDPSITDSWNNGSIDALHELRRALHVMQDTWFALWLGTWPTAIDWTAAVLDTHLVGSLATFSRALHYYRGHGEVEETELGDFENEINRYFGQTVAYYFGEDAFSIRYQAYDDMLWVVLGWLEGIKTVRKHSELHYDGVGSNTQRPWHGTQFASAFAHRAHVFYDLAAEGWDSTLCGGGMTWNPRLGPYKNAVTNELYISASIAMYLYFPGDNNTSPLSLPSKGKFPTLSPTSPQNPDHLHAAIQGYDWLANIHMRNRKGLYVDGFHVHDWKSNGTKCDERNEMVYTYNQGIVLSGLRGLWESTGNVSYLVDGHELIRDVIAATGWDLQSDSPVSGESGWVGLGRGGIMEDRCDATGRCDQTPQSFKGIFFLHLTTFCEVLPSHTPLVPGKTYVAGRVLRERHRQECMRYISWVRFNARAALSSRDSKGKFGMWWGWRRGKGSSGDEGLEAGAVDYRNDASWLESELWRLPETENECSATRSRSDRESKTEVDDETSRDPNDRGIGRTVETQGGGVAVLRALWELEHL